MHSSPKLYCSKPLTYTTLFNPYNRLMVTNFYWWKNRSSELNFDVIQRSETKPAWLQVSHSLLSRCSLIDKLYGMSFCLPTLDWILFPLNSRDGKAIMHEGEKFRMYFQYPPVLWRIELLSVRASKLPNFSLLVELTENIGLPLKLLEKHDPWPAYVTYTSPLVRRLIEKSKARELECMKALEESGWTLRQNKSSSIIQLRRRKSSKTSSNMVFEDAEPMLSVGDAFSVLVPGNIVFPETVHLHTDSRDCPTANYNKIIFSRNL